MSFTEHGTCTTCGREFRLRKNGTVWNHGTKAPFGQHGWRMNCDGAGQPPATEARAVLGQNGGQQ